MNTFNVGEKALVRLGNEFDSGGISVERGPVLAVAESITGLTIYLVATSQGVAASTVCTKHNKAGELYSTTCYPKNYMRGLAEHGVTVDDYIKAKRDVEVLGTNLNLIDAIATMQAH